MAFRVPARQAFVAARSRASRKANNAASDREAPLETPSVRMLPFGCEKL